MRLGLVQKQARPSNTKRNETKRNEKEKEKRPHRPTALRAFRPVASSRRLPLEKHTKADAYLCIAIQK